MSRLWESVVVMSATAQREVAPAERLASRAMGSV